MAPEGGLLFAGARDMEVQVRVSGRQPGESVDREVEALLVVEPPGGEEMTAGRPGRAGTGCFDGVRDHAHVVGVQLRNACSDRVTDAIRDGRDGVGRTEHAERDPVERERRVESPVHADHERQRRALLSPPDEEHVVVEPVNVPESDFVLRLDVP